MSDDCIKIKHNLKDIDKLMIELANRVKNAKPTMRKIGLIIKNYVDQKFETEGEYNGEKWKGWSESWTKERQKRKSAKGKILSLEGELRESIDDKITDESVQVGTNKVYAAIHNFGGDVKKRNGETFDMPKRQYLSWEDNLKELIKNELIEELKLSNE